MLDEAELLTIALSPAARGHGHGRMLLDGHLAALAREGVRVVHLEVADDNAAALALYRHRGFREVGRRPSYYPKPDGGRAAALAMSAAL